MHARYFQPILLDIARASVNLFRASGFELLLATVRNKLMHALHGNTSFSFSLAAINPNGLNAPGKWATIASMAEDVVAISETHATIKSQKLLRDAGEDRQVFWGAPVGEKSRCGVAFLVRKSCAWAIREVKLIDKCGKYYSQGRLHAIQLFRGDGKRSVMLYCVYGHVGARWEADKRTFLHEMLEGIFEDVAMRGGIPAAIVGDYNIEVGESALIQRYLRCDWHDAATWSTQPSADMITSMKGKGSRIDLCLMNREAAGLCRSCVTKDAPVRTDHRVVTVGFDWPLACQVRYLVKNVGIKCKYQHPPRDYVPPVVDSFDVRRALARDDVNGAFDAWCRKADKLLKAIPVMGGDGDVRDEGHGRGRVRFQKLCQYPPVAEQGAMTLRLRQIAAALRRSEELLHMDVYGYRAQQT